jgi:hypothetical protein
MESKSRNDLRDRIAIGAAAALLGTLTLIGPAGCTGSDGSASTVKSAAAAPRQDLETLKQLAEQLWAARAAEDWSTVFRIEIAPNQEGVNVEDYATWASENEPFLVRGFEVLDTAADGDFGWVELKTSLGMRRFPEMPARDTHRWQKWRKKAGTWSPVPTDQAGEFPAAPVKRDGASEQQLLERFGEAWQVRVAGDWTSLYEMVDPRDRADSGKPVELPLKYISHDVLWVEVIGDRGRVQVAYLHKLDDPNLSKMEPQNLIVTENWIRIEGIWYLDVSTGEE